MNASAEYMSYWSMRMLTLLQLMAAKQTNAVLQLLSGVDRLQQNCRYPDEGLLFANGYWRTFYHCHETAEDDETEHGHFHLFTRLGEQQWAHVAGLSVDNEGVPLRWFTVNRWVTDGPWLERDELDGQLGHITGDTEEKDLTTSWLSIMLRLYRDELQALLKRRDKQLQSYLQGRDRDAVLDDRELYFLSKQEIDMSQMLEKHLLYQHGIENRAANEPECRPPEE